MSDNLEQAWTLYKQSRYDLAEDLLRQQLAADPNDATAHAYLGLVLLARNQGEEATREAELAVHLSPEFSYAHYALAYTLYHRDRPNEALAAVEEAIRLSPENASYAALLSEIHYDREDWRASLAAAERGLQTDPGHVLCANRRAMVLMQLGRRKEAETTASMALAQDPENALTHTIRGWLLLWRMNARGSLDAFREALRLNPGLEWAREGLVEALKARHWVYRPVLRYLLWGRGIRLLVLIVLVVGYVALYFAALADGDNYWVWPLAIVLLLAIILTQMGNTFFNTLLWLQPSGRLVLAPPSGKPRTWTDSALVLLKAVWILTCVLLAVTLYAAGWLTLNIFILLAGRLFAWFADLALKRSTH